jgi:hypothetical protein
MMAPAVARGTQSRPKTYYKVHIDLEIQKTKGLELKGMCMGPIPV